MENPASLNTLIQSLKRRDAANWTLLLLDAMEPVAPLLAQSLWIAQPLATPFHARDAVAELAEALETPEGIMRLKQRLADEGE